MKKKHLIFSLLILQSTGTLFAQVTGNYGYLGNTSYNSRSDDSQRDRNPTSHSVIYNNNEIVVEVNGLMNVIADDYVATFNLVQVAETADSTNTIMNRKIESFRNALSRIGINSNDIKVDMLTLVPRYDLQVEKKLFSKTYNEVPAGFELQKNISIRFGKSEKLDEIVLEATKLEIYDLVKVDYYLKNVQVSLDSIRNRCIEEVKSKTKSFASLGFKLEDLTKVVADNFTTTYPPTRYYSYSAFCRPSLQAAKKKEATVIEIPKVVSQYYSGVDYDKYDIVINPVVIEPVVQVSYTITVKYFLQPNKPGGTYFMVNANGGITEIKF